MENLNKTFCDTHCRHLRLLFLVDTGVNAAFLTDLMTDNYQLWGGRYNPILAVHAGELSAYDQSILPHFDPDIVFYTIGVGLETARRLCQNLHPRELQQLDPNGRNNFPGVYALNLIPEAHRLAMQFIRPFSLVYFQRHEVDPQTSFYNLSFGIHNQYVDDFPLGQGIPTTILDVTDIGETNRQLVALRPFFPALLSETQVEITLLRPSSDFEYHCVELVIYDAGDAFEDLLYFWNRQLYQRPEGRIRQLIISREQLALFMADAHFGPLLRSVSGDADIYLHSFSLDAEELLAQRDALRAAFPGVGFRLPENRMFPRTLGPESFPYPRELRISKQLLIGQNDHLRLASPSWKAGTPLNKGTYIYDAAFFTETELRTNYLKLPHGTVTNFLLGNHTARVNKAHHVSFFLNPDTQGLDVRVPGEAEIFQTRLRSRNDQGELVNGLVDDLRPSDAGLKLSAYVNLFDGQLMTSADILVERFWVDLILGQTTAPAKKNFEFRRAGGTPEAPVEVRFHEKVSASNIHNYDGIFSYEDLLAERRLIYLEHSAGTRAWLEAHGAQQTDDELIAFMTRSAAEDFEMHIDRDLQYLVDRDALFIGMKVKCGHCGSNSWYPLAELKNKMPCRGCLQTVIPAVKSPLYYRFNDVIYNNISSDPVKRSKNYHGNYVVLRTLNYFAQRHQSMESFYWAPSMDAWIRVAGRTMQTDIDIVMVQNGRLILGEAKANADQFTADQFVKLQQVAEAIRPDSVLLAYCSGTPNEARLARLQEALKPIGCTVITHCVAPPAYFFGRLG